MPIRSRRWKRPRADPLEYLISDIKMRGVTGVQLVTLLRQELPACKIRLFSSQLDATQMVQKTCDASYDFHSLQKPIRPTERVAVMRSP